METAAEDTARLQALRKDPEHSEALLEFARKRHVEEAIHFLSTVEAFEDKVKEGVLELVNLLNSTPLIDLSPSTRQDLMEAVSEEKYALKIFVPLRNEITAFLLNNILPKFVEEELSDFKAQVNQLNKVLRNQKTRKKFILATRKAGAGNAIDFWMQHDAVSERVAELAFAIWDTYISQGTDSQINISAQVVDDIQKTLLQFPDIHIFSEAYKHVAYLLAMDVVPDYLDTVLSPRWKQELSQDLSPQMSRAIPFTLQRKPALPRTKSFDSKSSKNILKEGKNYNKTLSSSSRKKAQERQLPEEFLVRTKPKSQIQKDLSKATQTTKPTSKAQKLLGEECTIVLEKSSDGSIPIIGAPSLAPAMAQQPSHVSLSKLKKMFGEVVPVQKFEDPDSENYDDFSDESPRLIMAPRQQLRLKKFFGQTPDDKTNLHVPTPKYDEVDDDEDTLPPLRDINEKKEKKRMSKGILRRLHQTPETPTTPTPPENYSQSEIVRKNKLTKLLGKDVPESLIRRKPLAALPEWRNNLEIPEIPGNNMEIPEPQIISSENNVTEVFLLLVEKAMENMENFFDVRVEGVGKLMVEEQEKQGFSEEQVQFIKSMVHKEVQLYRQEVFDQLENLQIHILNSAVMSRAEGAEHGKTEVATKLSDSQTEPERSLKHSNGLMGAEESIPECKDVSGESPKSRCIIKYRHTKFSNDDGDNTDHSISHHRPGRSPSPHLHGTSPHLHGTSPRPPTGPNRWDVSPVHSNTTSLNNLVLTQEREVLGVNERVSGKQVPKY